MVELLPGLLGRYYSPSNEGVSLVSFCIPHIVFDYIKTGDPVAKCPKLYVCSFTLRRLSGLTNSVYFLGFIFIGSYRFLYCI